MAGSRKPGPDCSYNNAVNIEDGTMCRTVSPPPLPIGTVEQRDMLPATPYRPGAASHPIDSTVLERILRAASWGELQRWAEIALGPASFNLGLCYGMVASAAVSAVDLLDLLKTF